MNPDMSDQLGSSHLRELFEAALQDYQKQTGIALSEHPLAEKLQNCDSVESVTIVLREQTQAFSEFREKDKVLKPLKTVLSGLHKLSAAADFGTAIGLQFTPVKAIHTGLGVLLSVVKGVIDSYESLADLLESIEHFLKRLDIYDKIPHTVGMTEIVVKILVELLSTLALVTKQIKEGKPKKLLKKLLGGEKDVEAVLQRLDRLTLDEARITAAQTLEVVYGLVQNVRVVIDDGKASTDHVMEALENMQQLVSDLNKAKREKLQQDIFTWLSPPDPWKNHHIACKSHHPGSAAWFLEGETFPEWKASGAPSSSLWIYGKPGAGKSVFCSTIIEEVEIMRKAGLASLAFFYCDFREEEKTGLRGLISSLLAQLSHQSDLYHDILSKFYSEHAKGLRRPSDDSLVGCLMDLLNLPGLAPVYLIVDALDECPNTSTTVRSSRAEVLNLLEELIKSQFPNLRICVTSRPETDIKDVLVPLIPRRVSLHDESGQKRDIEEYIKSVINTHPKNIRWKAEHRQLVIEVLTEKAGGMFRWVECQMAYICGCFPARIERALADLPETLDETYDRILREINKADWELAHRMFQLVAVASRPLRIEELAELLAFDFHAGTVPKFREGWCLEDPADAVSTCSSLLTIVDVHGYEKIVQFSHYSVLEFLTSTRLVESSDIILRRYHVSITSAHSLAARTCLGMLLHLDKDVVTSDNLEEWPLAKYAAEHWADHARFEGVSQYVDDGMKQLFDPGEPHLAAWVWIRDPDLDPRWGGMPHIKRPLPPLRTPLHYAAHWGLHFIIEFLVTELCPQKMDVHLRSIPDDATPLHLASKRGHMKAALTLIEHGADVNAKNKHGDTPLDLALQESEVDLEFIRMLIEHGAGTDVTSKSKSGSFRLHRAVEDGDVEVVRLLIDHGADVTAQWDGATPLHVASGNGQLEVARMLIECGADASAKSDSRNGQTPLHAALSQGQMEIARLLIEHGSDMTARDGDGSTPLHRASQWGEVEVARMLIEYGADVTARSAYGNTPLHLASNWGQLEIARMLVEHGADMTAQDTTFGCTPLHQASQKGQVEVALMLVEHGADVMAVSALSNDTPLHGATLNGQVEIASLLIELGADVTAKNKYGKTSLHYASEWGRHPGRVGIARMLIEHRADVTAQDKTGETPLHLASKWGQVEVVRVLIEHGADATVQDENGETSLHYASKSGQVEVVRMLIEHRADVNAQNKDGETPLHQALSEIPRLDEDIPRYVEVARMLIEHGTDVTVQNKYGKSPLHLALQDNHWEVARMLIERTTDVRVQNEDGETLLHLASRQGEVKATRMLIERGADVTAPTKDGDTPLHRASEWGQVEVARMLVEHGADATAKNKDGDTPLHLVPHLKQTEIKAEVARMLIERGANVTAQKENGETLLHLALTPSFFSYNDSQTTLDLTPEEVEVARMLIDRGVDVTAKNRDGESPLHLALASLNRELAPKSRRTPNTRTLEHLRQVELARMIEAACMVEVACMLIDCGADMEAENKDGETALHLALTPLDRAFAPSRDSRPRSQSSPQDSWPHQLPLSLMLTQVICMLIDRGADLSAQNKDGVTPLFLALTQSPPWQSPQKFRGQDLTQEESEIVFMLIDHGADVTAQNRDGETPLHLVSRRGNVAAFLELTERGADITAQNKDGDTPLHLALHENHVELCSMLIERIADVTVQNGDGENPLHLASRQGQVEFAQMLIERSADVTAQNKDGDTPLHLASQHGQVEITQMLIERSTDVTVQNKYGSTPIHLALTLLQTGSFMQMELTRGQLQVSRMLIDHGVDMAAQNRDGDAPLHLASRHGEVEIARMLIERSADLTAKNKDGNTPLHLALLPVPKSDSPWATADELTLTVTWGQVDVARMLIERGIDVMVQNKDGETPLHLASESGQVPVEIVRMLIEHGADVNSQNKDGLTSIQLASQGGHLEVTDVLLEHGAAADTCELPSSDISPVTSPAHTLADLPIPSHPSLTTSNVADTDLLQTPPPFSQPSSNDVLAQERNRFSVFFTRRSLCSLGLVAIAVALPFVLRSVPKTDRST